ncbi:MAG: 5-formyltetrahydrofolate cyclo-ligase [Candidatus Thermoplasmatota archaeon]
MESYKHNIEKQRLREEIWKKMTSSGIAIFPYAYGRIPNFIGSDIAGDKVTTLEEWKKAKIVFSNPDFAQKKIRENALKQNKILIMASPKLKHGFIKVDPSIVKGKENYASTISGAFKYGKRIDELIKPDLIITGCVAVDEENFIRLGKGGGYGDREIKMIEEKFGKVTVITTVHDIQVVKNIPFDENDTKVDIIVTPTRIIRRKI